MNRRTPGPTGYRNFPNPDGPVDHDVPVLKVEFPDGKLRAVLFGYACPVQVVRFGSDLTLVALPGETVVDYSLRLKSELRGAGKDSPTIWIAGYSNDVFAYIPSRRVLLEGGYEAGEAMKYMTTVLQPGPFAPTVEKRIIDKVHELNHGLETDDK